MLKLFSAVAGILMLNALLFGECASAAGRLLTAGDVIRSQCCQPS